MATETQRAIASDVVSAADRLNAELELLSGSELALQLEIHFRDGSESITVDQVTEVYAVVGLGEIVAESREEETP